MLFFFLNLRFCVIFEMSFPARNPPTPKNMKLIEFKAHGKPYLVNPRQIVSVVAEEGETPQISITLSTQTSSGAPEHVNLRQEEAVAALNAMRAISDL
jgi:hypothetical protein